MTFEEKEMPVKIITFGRLKDITGSGDILFDKVTDTAELIEQLHQRFPALANAPYIVAVDKQIISANTILSGENTVALLPPYSGG